MYTKAWEPKPFTYWRATSPINPLQLHVLAWIQAALAPYDCFSTKLPDPNHTRLALGFREDTRSEMKPNVIYGRLPKPRPQVFVIGTTRGNFPTENLFAVARRLLVRSAAHFLILVEGDPGGMKAGRVLWAEMAGNHIVYENGGPDSQDVFTNIAQRIVAHASGESVTNHTISDSSSLSWGEWSTSPVHTSIAESAHSLGQAGLIENEVELEQFGSSDQTKTILAFLEKAGLGEGMQSSFIQKLGVMGITVSGGKKVDVDSDPEAGQIVPISHITSRGAIVATPADCPIEFNWPSVEAHENGLIYLLGALVNAGKVKSFDDVVDFLNGWFEQHELLPIKLNGVKSKVEHIVHIHRHPISWVRRRVEVVRPDNDRFPPIAFPCGIRTAALQLLTALCRSKTLMRPGTLNKIVLAILPGHGVVAIGAGPRDQFVDALIRDIEWGQPNPA